MPNIVAETILRTKFTRSPVLGCFLLAATMMMHSAAKAADIPAPAVSGGIPVKSNPVPDAASQATALKALKQIYNPYPPQSPDGKTGLAHKLIEQAASSDNDLVSRFVMLREAADLASSGGDIKTALQAVDERARRFAIDGVSEKLLIITKAKSAHLVPAAASSTAEAAIQIGWQSLRKGDFDAAGRAATLAIATARESQDVKLKAAAQALASDVRRGQQEAARAKLASDKLVAEPTDPAASFTEGRFLCVWRGDWAHGLPLLVQCSDAVWKTLAAGEMAAPKEAPAQLALAEKWMALAEKETGVPRQQLGQHARSWYELAAMGLVGLQKTLAEKRAAELGDVDRVEPTIAAGQNLPPGPPNRRVLFFHGNNREEPVFQQISRGQMRNVAQIETAATLANAGSFVSVGIVVLGNEFLRDTPAAGFSDGVGRNLKHFVDGGGDLVVFEQQAGDPTGFLEKLFKIQMNAQTYKGVVAAIPALASSAKAAGIEPNADHFASYNSYTLPDGSVVLLRGVGDQSELIAAAVVPYGKGRVILIGNNMETSETPMDEHLLNFIYHYKSTAGAK